jgi:hypothetical protein
MVREDGQPERVKQLSQIRAGHCFQIQSQSTKLLALTISLALHKYSRPSGTWGNR